MTAPRSVGIAVTTPESSKPILKSIRDYALVASPRRIHADLHDAHKKTKRKLLPGSIRAICQYVVLFCKSCGGIILDSEEDCICNDYDYVGSTKVEDRTLICKPCKQQGEPIEDGTGKEAEGE